MKNPFESNETFTAFATIEAARFMMGEMFKEMIKPVHPMNAAVDRATH